MPARDFNKAAGPAGGINLPVEVRVGHCCYPHDPTLGARCVQSPRQIDRSAVCCDRPPGAVSVLGLDRFGDRQLAGIARRQKHPAIHFGHAHRLNRAAGVARQRIDVAAIGAQLCRRRPDRPGLLD